MKACIVYTIKSILGNLWKIWLTVAIMIVEAIFVFNDVPLHKIESLSPIPLYSLLVFLLLINSGIIHSDFTKGKFDIIFGKPISKSGYLMAKFLGVAAVAFFWNLLNFFYLYILSIINQSERLSFYYLGENFLIHLFDIAAVTVTMIFISILVAKGIDIIVFYALIIAGDMLPVAVKTFPVWLGNYFLSFRYSGHFYRLLHNMESQWLLFFSGFVVITSILAISSHHILKNKVER